MKRSKKTNNSNLNCNLASGVRSFIRNPPSCCTWRRGHQNKAASLLVLCLMSSTPDMRPVSARMTQTHRHTIFSCSCDQKLDQSQQCDDWGGGVYSQMFGKKRAFIVALTIFKPLAVTPSSSKGHILRVVTSPVPATQARWLRLDCV